MYNKRDLYDKIKELLKDHNQSDLTQMAYMNIVNQIYVKNAAPINDDLDDNSILAMELMKLKFVPGNIYMFKYSPKNPVLFKYEDKQYDISDTLPMLFLTSVGKTTIKGINLNYCPVPLRYKILEMIEIFDVDFFQNGGYEELVAKKKPPISVGVSNILKDPDVFEALVKAVIANQYPDMNIDIIFRTYSMTNMELTRYLPVCLWPTLIFLLPSNKKASEVLTKIWKLTGMSDIPMEF